MRETKSADAYFPDSADYLDFFYLFILSCSFTTSGITTSSIRDPRSRKADRLESVVAQYQCRGWSRGADRHCLVHCLGVTQRRSVSLRLTRLLSEN